MADLSPIPSILGDMPQQRPLALAPPPDPAQDGPPPGTPVMGSPVLPAPGGLGQMLFDLVGGAMPSDDNGVLQAITAWKRRGITPAALKALSAQRASTKPVSPAEMAREVAGRTSLNGLINNKQMDFHATGARNLQNILNSGQINPSTYEYRPAVDGVSTSRIPRVASKFGREITLALDPTKMPPTRPYVESAYEKTTPITRPSQDFEEWKAATRPGAPREVNPLFEFENRTYGKPIPASAIKEILVDKSVLPRQNYQDTNYHTYMDYLKNGEGLEEALSTLRNLARFHNVPLREFANGQQMNQYRADLDSVVTPRANRTTTAGK